APAAGPTARIGSPRRRVGTGCDYPGSRPRGARASGQRDRGSRGRVAHLEPGLAGPRAPPGTAADAASGHRGEPTEEEVAADVTDCAATPQATPAPSEHHRRGEHR